MKIALKITLSMLCIVIITIFGITIWGITVSANAKLDESLFVSTKKSVVYLDRFNNEIQTSISKTDYVKIDTLPSHLLNSFIAVEDKRFYSHNGVDYKGLARALLNNLKTFSFKEGGSTITQQLIKNTHLSSEKTLKRKFVEMNLAKKLEKKYSKNEILEFYLNSIYFGEGNYGISSASKHYFAKEPENLTLNESAVLAGIIKAPLYYSPNKNIDKCNQRKDLVLTLLREQNLITENEYNDNFNKTIILPKNSNSSIIANCYVKQINEKVEQIISHNPYFDDTLFVKTYYDPYISQSIIDELNAIDKPATDYGVIVTDKYSNVLAFNHTAPHLLRQPGSTLKPLLVYAPAIEYDLLDACTILEDQAININGYIPKNYNDKYYGKISVRNALSKSSNVCAVKVLNTVGIEKSKALLEKTNINFNENDDTLRLALGSMDKGVNLLDLTTAYNVFSNDGVYNSAQFIEKIYYQNGKIVYKPYNQGNQIISGETASIMNDMLSNCVSKGTAKKLSLSGIPLYAKTGTVGNSNGNTDAYCISYSSDYTIGVWLGNSNSSYMPNNVTGGGLPCSISKEIWSNIYKDSNPRPLPCLCNKVNIDKIAYDEKGEVIIADDIAPKRYVMEEIFKSSRIPKKKSSTFSSPMIEIKETLVNESGFLVRLCQTEYIKYRIFKITNGKKKLIFDSKNTNLYEYLDTDVLPNEIYEYTIVPYYEYNGKDFVGKEIFINKIKMPIKNGQNNDDWWINDI